MNLPELTPQQAYLVRTALKLIGTAAAAHGATRFASFINTSDTVELAIGLVTVIIGIITGWKASAPAAIQQAAADTLPPGTVLPATTDAAPKATVMTPESATEFIRKPPIGQTTANPVTTSP